MAEVDLSPSAPLLKSHIRNVRAKQIYVYFQEFSRLYQAELDKSPADRKIPKFCCPKPTLQDCITSILKLVEGDGAFTKATFTEGVKRCFLKTGLAPNGEGEFTQYEKAVSKGTMSRPPAGTVHKDEFVEDANDCFLKGMKDFEHFEELDDMLYGAPEDEGDESEGDESEGDEIDIDENE